jgi:hypothetical protein
MESPGSRAESRISRELPAGTLDALETRLSPTSLRTLLMAVARARSERVRPADLIDRWQSDRFVRPSATDPRPLAELEAGLWRLLPPEVAGIELSPVAPLGTSAAIASVSQNRIVSTARGTEVVSDSTTALAIEAATRRRGRGPSGQVELAAAHRLLRAQQFGPGVSPHFRLFALVSSARDTGTARTESRLLRRHIRYWLDVLLDVIPDEQPRVEVTCWPEGRAARQTHDAIRQWVDEQNLGEWVVEAPDRSHARGYYEGIALRLSAHGGDVELGDGGLTSWTAQLLGDAKERCLVSCISTERLLELAPEPQQINPNRTLYRTEAPERHSGAGQPLL